MKNYKKQKGFIENFRNNIIFMTMLPIVIGALTVSYYIYGYLGQELKEENNRLSSLIVENIKSYLELPTVELKGISELIIRGHSLKNISTSYFTDIILMNENGIIYNKYPYEEEYINMDMSNQDYFRNTRNNDGPYWTNSFRDIFKEGPVYTLTLNIKNEFTIMGYFKIDGIKKTVENLDVEKDAIVTVTDSLGNYMVHKNQDLVERREVDPNYRKIIDKEIKYGQRVKYYNQEYIITYALDEKSGWMVIIYNPVKYMLSPVLDITKVLGIVLFLSLLISIFSTYAKGKKIKNFIDTYIDGIKKSSKGNYCSIEANSEYEEFNIITEEFNNMIEEIYKREDNINKLNEELEKKVEKRTNEINQKNMKLKKYIEELRIAQKHIVDSEKNAVLVNLVGGVAHEINTPVGVGITAVTYIGGLIKKAEKDYNSGKLKKKEFENLLSDLNDGVEIILSNLNQVSNIVEVFKQLTSNQESQEIKKIDIKMHIDAIMKTMESQLRAKNIKMDLSRCEKVEIKSYSVAFLQIVSNLVSNSLSHGYELKQSGTITLESYSEENYLVLIYFDDGDGISKEVIDKIYNPFFTTKRNLGGIGLGLNIVYNIVTNLLKGTIECTSEEGKGTKFIIKTPIDLSKKLF